MIVESQIAASLKAAVTAALDGLNLCVRANWLKADTFDQTHKATGGFVDISLGGRAHTGYTSKVATFTVTIEVELRPEADPEGSLVIEVYDRLITLFDRWHGSIAEVKNALNGDRFDAVGFTYQPASFYRDENLTWNLTQQLTINGRINQ